MAKARARDTDGTQMETDDQAGQRNTALHTLTLSLSLTLLCVKLLVSRSCEALTLSFTLSASALVLVFFSSLLLSLSYVHYTSSLALALCSSEPPTLSVSVSQLKLLPCFPTHCSHGPGAPVTSQPPLALHPPHPFPRGSWPIIHC